MKLFVTLIIVFFAIHSYSQTVVYFDLSNNQTVLKLNAIDTTQYTIDSMKTDTLFKEDTVIQIRAAIPSFRHIIPDVYKTYGVHFNLHYEAGGFNYIVDSALVQIHSGTSSDLSVFGDLTDTIYLDSIDFIDYKINNVNNGGRYELTSTVFHLVDTFFVSSVVTSLEEMQEEPLIIYPNPTKDILNIEGHFGKEYDIFDLKGIIINSGIIVDKIDISNLRNGIYFLRIEDSILKITKE